MATVITEEEAKEAGVKREVLQQWSDVMQALWTAAIKTYEVSGDERLLPKQGGNEIIIGTQFRISSNMCNNSFVETELYIGKMEIASIRYDGMTVTTLCKCIFIIIVDHFKNDF